MNGVGAFCHIVAGGFDAGRSVRRDRDIQLFLRYIVKERAFSKQRIDVFALT